VLALVICIVFHSFIFFVLSGWMIFASVPKGLVLIFIP
jgi:hypothetical protein